MKRRLLIVVIFLLAGAVVNVAVAWGCVAVASWPSSIVDSPDLAMVWPREVPEHWPPTDVKQELRGFGLAVSRALGRSITSGENGGIDESDHYLIDLNRVGWPLQTLQWETWREYTVSKDSPAVHRYAGHPDFTGWRTGLEPPSFIAGTNGFWKRLPIRPTSVLAFAANTLVYASLLWFPFVLRRFIRVKRGLCPSCAYPVGESPVCSECGKALPGRARVAT